MSFTRRELVYKAIAHEDVGHIPYAISFTGTTAEMLAAHYGTADLDAAIGNCIRGVPGPWWEFVNYPDGQWAFDPPARVPDVRGTGSFSHYYESITQLRENTDCFLLVHYYASLFEKGVVCPRHGESAGRHGGE